MIHLTIDGIPVEVEKGTTILQAARQIGVRFLHSAIWKMYCRMVPVVCAW